MSVLNVVKGGVFSTARRIGLMSGVADSGWRRQRLLILCYHGIAMDDEHEWNGGLYVPQRHLRQRFEFLRSGGYSVLPLDEGVRRLYDGTLPQKAVTLTFDDGAYDFYACALPLLREFGFPATVYVPTYYVGFQRPVFDPMIAYLAWKGRNHAPVAPDGIAAGTLPLAVSTSEEREATVARIGAMTLDGGFDGPAKDDIARLFAERLSVDYDALLARRFLHLMTADELRESAAAGIDIQLHTHRHRVPDDAVLFRREIDDNRRELQRILGDTRPTRHFCYPSGEYRSSFLPWLKAADVATATTCDPGIATSSSDPLMLPRFIDTSAQSPEAFEAWASGFAELLPRRTRRAQLAG
ncbi:MAG: polysaccharide deacetylase family protein [Gemmatimonadaceae bacterium]